MAAIESAFRDGISMPQHQAAERRLGAHVRADLESRRAGKHLILVQIV